MRKQSFLILLNIIVFLEVSAQNNSGQLLKVVPPSPVVASLGKYGDVPVGLYTGIPNVSVPLYEIKDGSISLPISLSYHAGGIKVEEIASPVGLSWSLNAGGVIGRNVRGIPDEISGWSQQGAANSVENILTSGNSAKIEQLASDVDRGLRDGESDIYYYNFNQFSGKFFYDQNGLVHTLPAKNILINNIGNAWKITAEDGTVYTFDKAEQVNSVNCSPVDQSVYTAWFLSNIKSADGKREISFMYDKVNYTFETLIGQTKYFASDGSGGLCMTNPGPCKGTQNYNTHRLARINFTDGYVKFNYNTVRYDLITDKSLDEMEVYNTRNTLIKRVRFGYSLFGDNSDGYNIATQNSKRLKLISITEGDSINSKPPHLFEYNESIALPGRLSYAQDHWGYYNGKPNADLIATFTTTLNSGQQFTFTGADRNANPATSQAGILTKIKYPMGGETLFTYENNSVTDNRVESQMQEQVINFAANQPIANVTNPYFSDELVIPAQGAQVQFNVSGLSDYIWYGCDIVHCYIIKDGSATPFSEISNSWNGASVLWQVGTYKLKLVNECSVNSIANFSITMRALIPTVQTISTKPVGGLRISKIEDKPGDGGQSIVKNYKYHPGNDTTHSSGVLVNFPDYGYDLTVSSYKTDDRGNQRGAGDFCSYRVRQSFSNYPLATTQGSYVGYSHVTVDLGENGQSEYFYNVDAGLINQRFPFAPVDDFDWARGFLVKTKDFIRKNEKLLLAKETINSATSFNQLKMYGIKTGKAENILVNGEMVPRLQALPKYSFYPTTTEFYALGQTTEKLYDQIDTSRFIESITDYTYSPQHLQIIQSTSATSRSDDSTREEIVSNKKYAFDYLLTGVPSGIEATAIKNLQDIHAANAVIEEYIVKQNRNVITNQISNQRVVNGAITSYKTDNPYPDQLLRLENSTPVPVTTFGNGSLMSNNAFVKNADAGINNSFKPSVIFNSYDSVGNITMQQKAFDVKKSYIWGYNYSFPIAEVTGVDYDTVLSVSGLSQLVLQSTATSDDVMRMELNKIRLHFPAAFVTTYTYKPLVGISSQTDVNNRTIYYEYDSLGRLLIIRDQDKNILKKFCYNYQGQQGTCIVNVATH
jgi:YD repeat-containing protein